jgi:hypothetical protein
MAGCDSGPSAPQVASVRVDGPATVVVGQTIQLSATPLDASGQAVPGQPVIWSSSSDAVLQVGSDGRATGVSVGSATARAQVAGITGSRTLEVIPVPVASIEVEPAAVELVRGSDLLLEVTLRDAGGNVLTGRTILFESANPGVASVSVAGRIQGVQAGSTTVTVRSGTATLIVPVTVLPGEEPVVEDINPATIREGETFEIEGRQFAPVAGQNVVRLGDELLVVIEASESLLRVRVPNLVCLPSGGAAVTVEVGGDVSGPFPVTFEASGELDLAPGQFHLVTAAQGGCLRLEGGAGAGEFLVGIQSVSNNGTEVTPVTFRGRPAGTLAPVTPTPDVAPAAARVPGGIAFEALVLGRMDPTPRILAAHSRAEQGLRTAEEALLGPAAGNLPLRAGALQAGGPAAVPATVQLGDTVRINVPDITPGTNFCANGIEITTVVRRNGTRAIWLEDVTNPGGGLSAADYSALGQQFDNQTLPTLTNQFGELTDLDANNRVVVVVSQQVNRFGNILGFVVSSDLFPTSDCAASNEGEFYYSVTPDPDSVIAVPPGRLKPALTVPEFRSLTPRLAAHETTHIIQFGRRLYNTPGVQAFPRSGRPRGAP